MGKSPQICRPPHVMLQGWRYHVHLYKQWYASINTMGPHSRDVTAAWSHGVYTCVLLFVQMNVIPSGIWKLLPWMNQTCGGLQFWLISFDFPMQRGTEFEGRPSNRYTSNWLKGCQLAYQKLLKPWRHFMEFSKLFKGTVNLVYVNLWPIWNCDTVNYKWNNLSVNNCWKNY